MKIQVRYFAVFRERLGIDEEVLELPDKTTVAGAVAVLTERHPAVADLRGRFRVAKNQEFTGDDDILANGDEIALIPPVAGGQDTYARVLDEELSLDRVVKAVSGPARGGVVTFQGMVRNENLGRAVVRLEYEAYAEMAEKEIARVIREIETTTDGVHVAIEHRTGVLAIGDTAVVIAASAPHRAEAFAACRRAIDQLKERAPIWKKEIGEDGAEWIGLGP